MKTAEKNLQFFYANVLTKDEHMNTLAYVQMKHMICTRGTWGSNLESD